VNLIPFNPVSSFNFMPPSDKEVKEFQDILKNHDVNSTIRAQRGADIDAACGQLRLREKGFI
ncbi:MAG: 23S rRNA (adenine(2503)-C(2))-methyltransferase RlmN, partial [Candidatus Omnitrophota bacterium]|nr:23S rRNA (adenine(2503)-C(2))-methyltransferase RlmN [Candidatus Omnitrophota bacterium]